MEVLVVIFFLDGYAVYRRQLRNRARWLYLFKQDVVKLKEFSDQEEKRGMAALGVSGSGSDRGDDDNVVVVGGGSGPSGVEQAVRDHLHEAALVLQTPLLTGMHRKEPRGLTTRLPTYPRRLFVASPHVYGDLAPLESVRSVNSWTLDSDLVRCLGVCSSYPESMIVSKGLLVYLRDRWQVVVSVQDLERACGTLRDLARLCVDKSPDDVAQRSGMFQKVLMRRRVWYQNIFLNLLDHVPSDRNLYSQDNICFAKIDKGN
eukprot:g4573.t1